MYTHEDYKTLKKELGLKNKDIAEAIGLKIKTVTDSTRPSWELPTWAKAMIFIYKKMKN